MKWWNWNWILSNLWGIWSNRISLKCIRWVQLTVLSSIQAFLILKTPTPSPVVFNSSVQVCICLVSQIGMMSSGVSRAVRVNLGNSNQSAWIVLRAPKINYSSWGWSPQQFLATTSHNLDVAQGPREVWLSCEFWATLDTEVTMMLQCRLLAFRLSLQNTTDILIQ